MGAETFIYRGGVYRPHDMESLLLNAGDPEFMEKFKILYDLVIKLNAMDSVPPETVEYMRHFVQEEMKIYNFRDYGNPMYGGVHKRVVMKKSPHHEEDMMHEEHDILDMGV